jgi:hypothetical protein
MGTHWESTACFVQFKKFYDNIVREVCITMKVVRLIKMCLIGTYNKVQVGKPLANVCPIQNSLKQGGA